MYNVKILMKYSVKEQIFYEESILQVNAGSFDEAYQKAEIYVKQTMDNKRRNMYGDTVHCTVVDYLDCFQSDDVESDVQEVYSRIFQNHSEFSETKLVELLSDSCTREEMLPLRYFPDPK